MPRIRPWLLVVIIVVGVGVYVFFFGRRAPSAREDTAEDGYEYVPSETSISEDLVLTIAGRVLSSDGTPIENAEVSCSSLGPGSGGGSSDTDGEGIFLMADLAPGKYWVTVSHDTYAPAEIEYVYVDAQDPFRWLEVELPQGAFIAGTVRDDEGSPVPAFVRIESLEEVVHGWFGSFLFDGPIEVTHGSGDGTADDEGRYTTTPVRPGAYKITASDRGHCDAEPRVVKLAAGEKRLDVDLVLKKKRGFISGKIVDADGNPLADVCVTIQIGEPDYVCEHLQTDADGAFAFREIAAGRYRVTVRVEGYLEEELKVTAPAGDVLITLRHGGSIKGRVVDKTTGEPIDDFVVEIEPHFAPFKTLSAGGFFEYGGLRTGLYELQVGAPGYAKTTVRGIRVQEGAETGGVLIELQPVEVATLVFDVTSALDGSLIEGARVSWNEMMGMGGGEAETDAEGHCLVDGVGPGRHKFTVDRPGGGFDELTVRPRGFAPKEVAVLVVEGEQGKRVEVALDPTLTLRGCVVSKADGRPIWGAMVDLDNETDDRRHRDYKVPVVTDRHGSFTFDEVMPGRGTFRAWHEDYALTETQLRITGAPAERLVIEMPVGARIFGTVVGPDGAPVPYVIVYAIDDLDYVDARADEAGDYSLAHVVPGRQQVHLSLENAGAGLAYETREIVVSDGDSVRVDFQLVHGATVKGRLTSRGQPIEDARLGLRSERTPVSHDYATTGDGGRYRFEHLVPGAYRMQIKLDEREHGYDATCHRRVEIGEGEVTLDIELGGSSVSGIVLDSAGTPLPRAHVSLRSYTQHADRLGELFSVHETRFRAHTHAASDGAFGLGSVPPAYGHAARAIPVEVRPDGDVSGLTVELGGSLALHARVRTYDGAPPPALSCGVFQDDGVRLDWLWVEPEPTTGAFTIEGLSSGRFLVLAIPYSPVPPGPAARYAPDVREVSVTPNQEPSVEFSLKAARQLNVLPLDENGEELDDAVPVLDPGGDVALARILNDYVFLNDSLRRPDGPIPDKGLTLYGIPDGDYTLRVRCEGYEDAAVAVRVAGGDEEITVTLKRANLQRD